MTRYTGPQVPVDAGDVRPGHLIVCDDAPAGHRTVSTRAVVWGEVVLAFTDGTSAVHPPDRELFRVTS